MFSELHRCSQTEYPWTKQDTGVKDPVGNHESDLEAVKDERRPAAWAGNISPNVDMAAADLSLNIPTCPSVRMDPNLNVLSPNLLPTWPLQGKHFNIETLKPYLHRRQGH